MNDTSAAAVVSALKEIVVQLKNLNAKVDDLVTVSQGIRSGVRQR
jgi:hypothetical protein